MAPKSQSQAITITPRQQKTSRPWDIETPCQMAFTGVRARSANAILFTSPVVAPSVRPVDPALSQGKEDGEEEEEDTDGVRADRNECKSFISDDVNVQAVDCGPYLSIGTCPDEPSDVNAPGQAAKIKRGLHRISTWPPTAAQWLERCKRQREGEDGHDLQPRMTPMEEVKGSCHIDTAPNLTNQFEQNSGKVMEDDAENQEEFKSNEIQNAKDLKVSEMTDNAVFTSFISDSDDLVFGDSLGNLDKSNLEEHDFTAALQEVNPDRDRAGAYGKGSRNSKAPPGGGDEPVFLDLLHEVVQNRGRWTRDRWRQIHVSK